MWGGVEFVFCYIKRLNYSVIDSKMCRLNIVYSSILIVGVLLKKRKKKE